jgi:hydrogenase nickel incorporation protein HypA/HybF
LHEWSIANGIVEALLSFQKEHKAKIGEVEIAVGQISGIETGILKYALVTLSEDEVLKAVKYKVYVREAMFKCQRCRYVWDFKECEKGLNDVLSGNQGIEGPEGVEPPLHFLPQLVTAYVRCPKCGSRDMNIIDGMDTVIKQISLDGG